MDINFRNPFLKQSCPKFGQNIDPVIIKNVFKRAGFFPIEQFEPKTLNGDALLKKIKQIDLCLLI